MNKGVGNLAGIWTCGRCDRPFTDEAECAEHEGFCEGGKAEKGWECPQCRQRFEKHSYTHVCNNVSYKCPFCQIIIPSGGFHTDEECRMNRDKQQECEPEKPKFNCDYCQDTGYVPYPYFPPPWTDYNGTGWPCVKCSAPLPSDKWWWGKPIPNDPLSSWLNWRQCPVIEKFKGNYEYFDNKESEVGKTEYKHCPYCDKPVRHPCIYVCIDCQIKLFKESEVKDKYQYRSQCTFCKTWTNTKYPQYLNYVCQDCEKKLKPTHTVELTELEVDKIHLCLNLLPDSVTKAIIAKLRPKKESVDIEIDGINVKITTDGIYFLDCDSALLRWWEHGFRGYPRDTFDKIIAAYHAHVDEVK